MSGKERFEKEALGGSRISGRTEPEIERVSLRIDGSVEVDPLIFDFDRGLIDLPRIVCHLHVRTTPLFKSRCVVLDPPIHGRMVDRESTFQHHLLKLPIA